MYISIFGLIHAGRVQLRWAYIYANRDKIILKLGKKCLYGAFTAYKECKCQTKTKLNSNPLYKL